MGFSILVWVVDLSCCSLMSCLATPRDPRTLNLRQPEPRPTIEPWTACESLWRLEIFLQGDHQRSGLHTGVQLPEVADIRRLQHGPTKPNKPEPQTLNAQLKKHEHLTLLYSSQASYGTLNPKTPLSLSFSLLLRRCYPGQCLRCRPPHGTSLAPSVNGFRVSTVGGSL